MMHEEDLIICDMGGNKLEGHRERTTEIAMHLTIYEMRPDIRAVVHAHPPVSTGFAAAGRSLNLALLPEVVLQLGCVPLADYGLPGTPALTDGMVPYIPNHDALLMANHGAVCYADELYRAFFKMETLEHFARITLVAELLGGPNVLPRKEVQALVDARARYGISKAADVQPGCPVVAEDLGGQEKIEVTRDELIALIEEAVRRREGGF
jgi:L-fuculose-phosphate aldolase